MCVFFSADTPAHPKLPLFTALVASLYRTREAGYRFTVFVTANEGDLLLGDRHRVARLFSLAANRFGGASSGGQPGSCGHGGGGGGSGGHGGVGGGGGGSNSCLPLVAWRLVLVPRTVVPSRSLSALFNIPTLAAVGCGCAHLESRMYCGRWGDVRRLQTNY